MVLLSRYESFLVVEKVVQVGLGTGVSNKVYVLFLLDLVRSFGFGRWNWWIEESNHLSFQAFSFVNC